MSLVYFVGWVVSTAGWGVALWVNRNLIALLRAQRRDVYRLIAEVDDLLRQLQR